jgi:hypothetical protein
MGRQNFYRSNCIHEFRYWFASAKIEVIDVRYTLAVSLS